MLIQCRASAAWVVLRFSPSRASDPPVDLRAINRDFIHWIRSAQDIEAYCCACYEAAPISWVMTTRGVLRPDIEAARRGGDWSLGMDGEGNPAEAAMDDVKYWIGIYTEIVAMEEKVLARIKELMKTQRPRSRREVELTNVPVVVAQVERFRQRLGYWEARRAELIQLDGS